MTTRRETSRRILPPKLLTVEDIQRMCQCSEARAYQLAHEAGTVRLGRSLRVRPEDLDAHLRRLTVRGVA
jgi:hypothetical protein